MIQSYHFPQQNVRILEKIDKKQLIGVCRKRGRLALFHPSRNLDTTISSLNIQQDHTLNNFQNLLKHTITVTKTFIKSLTKISPVLYSEIHKNVKMTHGKYK
ncbi:MAG TPA: hypothetical protein VFG45_02760 [Candidatus Nitrosocosmicus sp.]|nr:hypothetical protein [Candidatus Nitrosocosmicus sp.]